MPNLDKKINEFVADIRRLSENETKSTEKEMASYKAACIKEAEVLYKEAARKNVKRSVETGSAEIASELAKKHMEAREELVKIRSKMTDEIIECAGKKLLDFTKSEAYPESLCKSAKKMAEVLQSNKIVLYVKPEDLVYSDMIKKSFGKYCTVEADKSIVIGGIRGYDKILFKLADETLDEKLAVQREYFVYNSGLTISIR